MVWGDPGGDYAGAVYPENGVVVDNPPPTLVYIL